MLLIVFMMIFYILVFYGIKPRVDVKLNLSKMSLNLLMYSLFLLFSMSISFLDMNFSHPFRSVTISAQDVISPLVILFVFTFFSFFISLIKDKLKK